MKWHSIYAAKGSCCKSFLSKKALAAGVFVAYGFTLIELLLVITILMIFSASAVYYMSPALSAVQLEEGADRFESMFRFASAEATQSGKRLLVRFVSTNDVAGRSVFVPQVAVENDPIGNPGVFTPMPQLAWLDESVGSLVSVIDVLHDGEDTEDLSSENEEDETEEEFGALKDKKEGTMAERMAQMDVLNGDAVEDEDGLTNAVRLAEKENFSAILGDVKGGGFVESGSEPQATETEGADEDDLTEATAENAVAEVQDILFYPDGSSDTVQVVLVSTDKEDRRMVLIRLNGVTGLIEHEILQTDDDGKAVKEEEEDEESADEDLSDDLEENLNENGSETQKSGESLLDRLNNPALDENRALQSGVSTNKGGSL